MISRGLLIAAVTPLRLKLVISVLVVIGMSRQCVFPTLKKHTAPKSNPFFAYESLKVYEVGITSRKSLH